MTQAPRSVSVEILGKTHHIACPEGQEQALRDAVAHLNGQVNQVKQRANNSNARTDEKALLMAALNICHELLHAQQKLHDQEQAQQKLCEEITSKLKE